VEILAFDNNGGCVVCRPKTYITGGCFTYSASDTGLGCPEKIIATKGNYQRSHTLDQPSDRGCDRPILCMYDEWLNLCHLPFEHLDIPQNTADGCTVVDDA
jgi:hypothetical protein